MFEHKDVALSYFEYLHELVFVFTQWKVILWCIVPFGSATNLFCETFSDTFPVIEIWVLIARVARNIQLLHLSESKRVIVG